MPIFRFPHPEKPESTVVIQQPTLEAAERVYRKWYPGEPGVAVEVESEQDWSETT
jgi:hypothetical protein